MPDPKDSLTIGELKKHYEKQLDEQIQQLEQLIRQGYQSRIEAKTFLRDNICQTLCYLDNLTTFASGK